MIRNRIRKLATFALFGAGLLWQTAASSAEPIRIGAVFTTTGAIAYIGEPGLRTVQLYIDQINRSGGVLGRDLQLIHYDDAGEAAKANGFAKRLIENDNVDVVIGGSTTGATMSMLPLLEKAGIPFVSTAGGTVIVEPVKKWVFKTPHTDRMHAERLLQDMKKRGFGSFALISETSAFGQSGRKETLAVAQRLGLNVAVDETYGPKDSDVTPQLTKVKNAPGVQALFVFGAGAGPATVTRNWAQLGGGLPLYQSGGSISEEFLRLSGAAAEGARLPGPVSVVPTQLSESDPQKAVATAYAKAYAQRWKSSIDSYSGNAYDALMIVVQAIKTAGTTDKEKVRAAIEGTRGLVGVNGVYNMSESDHLGLKPESLRIIEVKGGAFRLMP